jgi:CheY-like chemotaxis protein
MLGIGPVEPSAASSDQLPSAARRVLILDDSEISLQLESALLGMSGFYVRTAATIAEFHALLALWSPHVILTDLEMPELDGATLCQQLRADPETAKIPIVLFSSASNEDLARIAEAVGADAYLSKRSGYQELPGLLKQLCEQILW